MMPKLDNFLGVKIAERIADKINAGDWDVSIIDLDVNVWDMRMTGILRFVTPFGIFEMKFKLDLDYIRMGSEGG